MKKIFSIALIPVFVLATTFGVTLSYYSCKAMSGDTIAKPCCKNVGKGGCCKKESTILKVQDAFIKAVNKSNLSAFSYFIQEKAFSFVVFTLNKISHNKYYWDNAPPDNKVGFYILYRSIII